MLHCVVSSPLTLKFPSVTIYPPFTLSYLPPPQGLSLLVCFRSCLSGRIANTEGGSQPHTLTFAFQAVPDEQVLCLGVWLLYPHPFSVGMEGYGQSFETRRKKT